MPCVICLISFVWLLEQGHTYIDIEGLPFLSLISSFNHPWLLSSKWLQSWHSFSLSYSTMMPYVQNSFLSSLVSNSTSLIRDAQELEERWLCYTDSGWFCIGGTIGDTALHKRQEKRGAQNKYWAAPIVFPSICKALGWSPAQCELGLVVYACSYSTFKVKKR